MLVHCVCCAIEASINLAWQREFFRHSGRSEGRPALYRIRSLDILSSTIIKTQASSSAAQMDSTSNNFFFGGNQQFYQQPDNVASESCYSPFSSLYDSFLAPSEHPPNSLAEELAQMQQSAAAILQQSSVQQQQLDLLSFPELNLPYDFPTSASTSTFPVLTPSVEVPAPAQAPTSSANDAKDEEPLYVNAKQYHRIMHRRAARARLEEVHRLAKERKPYMHESRHKHACRRPRGAGGRFLTADELKAMKHKDEEGQTPLLQENSP